MKILVSRVDNIGDVILTLPLCGWLKKSIKDCEVYFLGKELTRDIVAKSQFIDKFYVWDGSLPKVDCILHVFPNKEVAIKAKKERIKLRVATSHRLYHFLYCNRLVNFSRIRSDLHEAQLNFKLLEGLKINFLPKREDLHKLCGWSGENHKFPGLDAGKFNLVFHIKSRGSAKEWKSSNYLELAKSLPSETFNIILTGTKEESLLIKEEIPEIFRLDNIINTTGKLSLQELIKLLSSCDGLLACSTGPLHIASVSGTNTLGLYPKNRPMHAGRWAPIGEKSSFIEESNESTYKYLSISVDQVKLVLMKWIQA